MWGFAKLRARGWSAAPEGVGARARYNQHTIGITLRRVRIGGRKNVEDLSGDPARELGLFDLGSTSISVGHTRDIEIESGHSVSYY